MPDFDNNFSTSKPLTFDKASRKPGSLLAEGRDELFGSLPGPRGNTTPSFKPAGVPKAPSTEPPAMGQPDSKKPLGVEPTTQPQAPTSTKSKHRQEDDPEPPAPDGLTAAFEAWQKDPNPQTLAAAVDAAGPLIEAAATSYAGGPSPLLRSRGRLLVAQALSTYNPKEKTALKTWLHRNLQGLSRYRNQLSPISVPERVGLDLSHVSKVTEELRNELGREPTLEEVSERSGLSLKRLKHIEKFKTEQASEGQLLDDEGASYLPGVDANSPENIWAELVYHDLDDRGKQIYDMLMGRNGYKPNTPIHEIAKTLGISPSAVSQRAKAIAAKLEEGQQYQGVL